MSNAKEKKTQQQKRSTNFATRTACGNPLKYLPSWPTLCDKHGDCPCTLQDWGSCEGFDHRAHRMNVFTPY